jgi:hypothetical protein
MNKIRRGVVIGSVGLVLACSLSFISAANAYSIGNGSTTTMPTGVNLPAIPAGTFNLNWNNFLNSLPIQGFINSLRSNGNTAVNNSIQSLTPNVNTGNGQVIFQQIDSWTSAHLGFRFSELFGAVLGVLSWILGLAKNVVDWLLNLVR